MITNLRYHMDGKIILVRWNYEDIDINTVRATCRLVKRINGELVKEIPNITWNAFHQNGGGCSFEMPDFPVRVEVEEQNSNGALVTLRRNVKEAPRYQLKSKIKMSLQISTIEERKGLFSRQRKNLFVKVDAECKLIFPNSLTDDEVRSVPGWLVVGHYMHPNDRETEIFFWPEEFHRGENVITLKSLPLLDEYRVPEKDSDIEAVRNIIPKGCVWFEIDPVVENSEYADLFLMDQNNPTVNSRGTNVERISLNKIKPQRNGLYPIVCPFCLETMQPHEPVFRAATDLGRLGYEAEPDEEYRRFCEKNSINEGMNESKRGRVFRWGDSEIVGYATAKDPNTFKEASAPSQGEVVVAIRDRKGNTTSDKLCVHCHNPIPVYSGAYPSVFIGMMGYTGSGKTVYKDCTIHMLNRQKLLPGYKLLCTANNNPASIEGLDRFSMLIGTSRARVSAGLSASAAGGIADQGVESAGFGGNLMFNQGLGSFGNVHLGGQGIAGMDYGSGGIGGSMGEIRLGSVELSSAQDIVDLADGMNATAQSEWQTSNLEDMLSQLAAKMDSQTLCEEQHEQRQRLPEATAVEYIEPYIYQLRSVDGQSGVIMCFFDFPGEVLDPRNTTNAVYQQYFKNLIGQFDGMVFLFDPMMLSCIQRMEMGMRMNFSSYTYQAEDNEAVLRIMEKTPYVILDYFRSKFLPVGQLHIPVVFAISKSDAIRDHMPVEEWRNLPFMDESANGGRSDRCGLDLQEIKENSETVLKFQGDPMLKEMSNAIADTCIWMCISATGIAPKDGTMEGRYGNPVRVMEPLEWILYQNQLRNK